MRDGQQNRWCEYVVSACAVITLLAPVAVAAQKQSPPEGSVVKQSPKAPAPQPPSSQPAAAQPVQPAGPLPEGESEWTVWTSGRYRITPGDVIELRFPFVPELDQTLAVQPDGYVTLREAGDLRVQGRTLPQFRADVNEAYMPFVRDPVFTAVLKEFEKPYFVAAGEVTKPGRYELRGATTLTQAIAYAGGATGHAKMTDVVIFRPYSEDAVSVKQINVKEMFSKRDLSEDPLLRPGDTIYLATSKLGKMAPVLSKVGLGLFLNPVDLLK
jgi:polysaccharide export outer membrane protein